MEFLFVPLKKKRIRQVFVKFYFSPPLALQISHKALPHQITRIWLKCQGVSGNIEILFKLGP